MVESGWPPGRPMVQHGPPTLEQASMLPWPPTGDFQSELTRLLPVSYPAEPGWGRNAGDASTLPESRLTWLGGQVGRLPGEAARGTRWRRSACPIFRENKGFFQTACKVTAASLWELDIKKN